MTILNMVNKTDLTGFIPSYLYDFISPAMPLRALDIEALFSEITIYVNYHQSSTQNHFLSELTSILVNDRDISYPQFNNSE